jgi:hypothetical protein
MVIELPELLPPGVYRGLVFAHTGDACIQVAITVVAPRTKPERVKEREQPGTKQA